MLNDLGPRSKIDLSESVHRTWKSFLDLGSKLGLFIRFLPIYFLVLEAFPFLVSVGILYSLTSGGRDGFNLAIPPPFLDISCSSAVFTLVFDIISMGL